VDEGSLLLDGLTLNYKVWEDYDVGLDPAIFLREWAPAVLKFTEKTQASITFTTWSITCVISSVKGISEDRLQKLYTQAFMERMSLQGLQLEVYKGRKFVSIMFRLWDPLREE